MTTEITYNVARSDLGEGVTNAQYGAYKKLVEDAIEAAFYNDKYGEVVVYVGDSNFCNASTCEIRIYDEVNECNQFVVITRDDVDEAVSTIGESWWNED